MKTKHVCLNPTDNKKWNAAIATGAIITTREAMEYEDYTFGEHLSGKTKYSLVFGYDPDNESLLLCATFSTCPFCSEPL